MSQADTTRRTPYCSPERSVLGVRKATPKPLQLPQRLGRYVVLGLLGRGGMGTVLEAYDTRLARALTKGHRERRRAQNLARVARKDYLAAEGDHKQAIAEIEAWLRRHGGR